jgi:hypothetical protein
VVRRVIFGAALLLGVVFSGAVASARESSQTTAASAPVRANVWVAQGAHGACRRSQRQRPYRPASACGSVQAAYSAANRSGASSLVLVRGGDYPAFQLLGGRSSKKRITIRPAGGERVTFGGAWSRIGSLDDCSAAPAYLTLKHLVFRVLGAGYASPDNRAGLAVGVCASHVKLANLHAGNFLIQASDHISVLGGSYGPCRADSATGSGPCEINKVDAWPVGNATRRSTNIVVDGVDLHDYNYMPSCVASRDCHWRPLYLNSVDGFTMRNSTIRKSVFEPWFTISNTGLGNHNILIENNYFGANVQAGAGAGFSFAWCENAHPGELGYANVTFRFNSFARGMAIFTPGPTCALKNFRVYGNIFGRREPSCRLNPEIAYSYNVYSGLLPGTCGRGDVNVGGLRMRFYRNDTVNPDRTNDYELVGRRSAADNRVPASLGCPRTDRHGVRRPHDGGYCDAGANER